MSLWPTVVLNGTGVNSAIKAVTFGFNATLTTLSSAADTSLVWGTLISITPTGWAQKKVLWSVAFNSTTGWMLVTLSAANTAAVTYTALVLRATGN